MDRLSLDRTKAIAWILASGIVNEDVWLAGGSLRTLIDPKEEVSDYDLFFKNQEYFDRDSALINKGLVRFVKQKLTNLGFKLTFECPEGKLYTYTKPFCSVCKCFVIEEHHMHHPITNAKVQLICEYFYSSPEELLSTFDLTPCLFATDGTFLYVYKSGIKSVKKKIAELHRLTYPVSSIKRLIKYANKGYNVNAAIVSIVDNLINRTDILATDSMRIYID
jgi:hypothetical protein